MLRIKSILQFFDGILFRGKFFRVREFLSLESLFRPSNSNYKITIYYMRDESNFLSNLCDKYGSDKGEAKATSQPYPWPSHSYSDFYWRTFSQFRHTIGNVLEVGIGTNNPDLASSMYESGKPGASLRVWKDFFPNANIYGADIDRNILFEEDRISTEYMDQLNSDSIINFFEKINTNEFDFICDDGLHTFEAGANLFTHSISKLSQSGIYVIEDVSVSSLQRYKDFFELKEYNVDFVTLHRSNLA